MINIEDLDGFVQDDWVDLECARIEIQKVREEHGIYRAPLQVKAESEVWMLINKLRSGKYSVKGLEYVEHVYFASQSRIIDQVFKPQVVTTWNPEALYRYLSALPGRQINPDLLQQCMLHKYFDAGISFIDKDRYAHFFGPSINAAKASYREERASYIKGLEDTYTGNIDEAFDQTPDLEKPFFVAQMGWQLAEASKRKAEFAIQRALDAENRIKQLESEKDRAWKIQDKRKKKQEAARLRNLQNPKHVRKRWRQTKKRNRKKK